MKSIFVIAKESEGPRGHGEPGEQQLVLATDGRWFELGNPRPAFTSREAAEAERKKFDKYNFYKVVELELNT